MSSPDSDRFVLRPRRFLSFALGVLGVISLIPVAWGAHAGWAIYAVLLFAAAFAVFWKNRRGYEFEDAGESLRCFRSGRDFVWKEFVAIRHGRATVVPEISAFRSTDVTLEHPAGVLVLPPCEDRDRLLARFHEKASLDSRPGGMTPNIALEYAEAVEKYGKNSVFATTGNLRRIVASSKSMNDAVILASGIAGLVILAAASGSSGLGTFLGALAGLAMGVAVVVLLFKGVAKLNPANRSRDVALLVTPEGVFMEGGETTGKLAWTDLLGVTVVSRKHSFGAMACLYLEVRGARTRVNDVYHHPLYTIREKIEAGMVSHRPPPLPRPVVAKPQDDGELL